MGVGSSLGVGGGTGVKGTRPEGDVRIKVGGDAGLARAVVTMDRSERTEEILQRRGPRTLNEKHTYFKFLQTIII